jgi:hypothetical protein
MTPGDVYVLFLIFIMLVLIWVKLQIIERVLKQNWKDTLAVYTQTQAGRDEIERRVDEMKRGLRL